MVNTSGYSWEYLDQNTHVRRELRIQKIGDISSKVLRVLKYIWVTGIIWYTPPAYGEGIQNKPESKLEVNYEWWDIQRRLEYQIDWILAEDGLYYTLLRDADYEITDKEWFTNFIVNFWGILLELHKRTNSLTWDDINNAMNLYSAFSAEWKESAWYIEKYDIFISTFPDPNLEVVNILERHGFPYHWAI